MKRTLLLLALPLLMASCIQPPAQKPAQNDRLIMATLFVEYAPEYKALCYQTYNIATQRLEQLVSANTNGTPLAIVLDIDETVLNNIPYQAKQVVDGVGYPDCWKEWCDLEDAEVVPGVRSFLQQADQWGVAIFYISNRKTNVLGSTLSNLNKAGLPQADSAHVLLRIKASEKETRRQSVIDQGYDIVMFFGDNLSDFNQSFEIDDNAARNQAAIDQKASFGTSYFVLPNPGYGAWTQNLGLNDQHINQDSLAKSLMKTFDCK